MMNEELKKALKKRVKKVEKSINAQAVSCAVVLPSTYLSNKIHFLDNEYSNPDFYYLTGSNEQDAIVVYAPSLARPVIISKPKTKVSKIWDGSTNYLTSWYNKIGYDRIFSKNPRVELFDIFKNVEKLYFYPHHQKIPQTLASRCLYDVLQELLFYQYTGINPYPKSFAHSSELLHPFRAIKDSYEVAMLREANRVTALMQNVAKDFISSELKKKSFILEQEVKKEIISFITSLGLTYSFSPIVGSNKNSCVLHYRDGNSRITRNSCVLIDCGAEVNRYCGDMTRTLFANATSPAWFKDIQTLVEATKEKCISLVKPGVTFASIHQKSCELLTQGLLKLKLLKGTQKKNLENKSFGQFFPHGLGHTIGLETHDVGLSLRNPKDILKQGMVITIEPGLYLQKKHNNYPRFGVRQEDTVLVTNKGCEVLTKV
jgi:Xaa-Pro aminopeptidase